MTTTSAIIVEKVGGPEVLQLGQREVPPPGQGEVQIEQEAVGLNFIDVYVRKGQYPRPLPFIPGEEGAGTVVAVGPGASEFKVGDRVAYAGVNNAYSRLRNIAESSLVPLPKSIEFRTAAAMMLKGMTAEYLLRRCRPVMKGDTVLFHSASGGVGQIAVPWAKALGARVFGVVGSAAKVDLAKSVGADEVLVQSPSLPAQVKELTSGRGVDVVYDAVGKDTFDLSLECLRSRGMMVSFGQSSGFIPPFDLLKIGGLRSLYLTRPSMGAYLATRKELVESAQALFQIIGTGAVKIPIPREFPLAQAADAHRALEARQTTGSVVLIP